MKQSTRKSALLTLTVIFITFLKGYSIGNETQVGARDISMGNASVALSSPFSVFHNVAALAPIGGISVAIDYRQPYLIEGFSQKALALVVPTPTATFAIGIQQQGIENYQESRFGLAMAKKFGENFSAGLQFNYFMIGFPEQGRNRGTFLIDFGILVKTSGNLKLGLHVFNPAGASIESLNLKSKLPLRVTAGIALNPADRLLLTSALEYRTESPMNIGLGIEYQLSDCLFLRCGVSGKPIRHSAGLGYRYKAFRIDFAIVHLQSLGYTPSISLTLNI